MINVIASIKIQEGQLSEFINIFKSNVPNVLKETGCIEYVPTIDIVTGLTIQQLSESVVTVIEKWASVEDLKAHILAPHMLAYNLRVENIVENVSLKIVTEA